VSKCIMAVVAAVAGAFLRFLVVHVLDCLLSHTHSCMRLYTNYYHLVFVIISDTASWGLDPLCDLGRPKAKGHNAAGAHVDASFSIKTPALCIGRCRRQVTVSTVVCC
jgi:hypothetical protein